jgi:hypothetical protein
MGLVATAYALAYWWVQSTMSKPNAFLVLWPGTTLAILCLIARPAQVPLIAVVAAGSITGGVVCGSFTTWVSINRSFSDDVFVAYSLPVVIGGLLAGTIYRGLFWLRPPSRGWSFSMRTLFLVVTVMACLARWPQWIPFMCISVVLWIAIGMPSNHYRRSVAFGTCPSPPDDSPDCSS